MTLHLSTSTERKLRRELADRPDLLALLPTVKVKRSVKLARERKATKKIPARQRRADVRAQAMERDHGRCVLVVGCEYRGPPHMHHVTGRHDERLETVAILCWGHHDRHSPASVHAGHVPTLRALAAWCVERGYADAARAVARKLSKIEEAQQSTTTAGRRN